MVVDYPKLVALFPSLVHCNLDLQLLAHSLVSVELQGLAVPCLALSYGVPYDSNLPSHDSSISAQSRTTCPFVGLDAIVGLAWVDIVRWGDPLHNCHIGIVFEVA